jgi:hypothetical protein
VEKLKAIVSLLILLALPVAPRADEKPFVDDATSVDAPLCKSISSKVQQLTHATFDHFSTDRTAVYFSHPLAKNIVVGCQSRLFLNVSIETDVPYPSDQWFYLAALAGTAITNLPEEKLEADIRACQRQALADSTGNSDANDMGVRLGCAASTDPAGTSISFFLRDAINNQVMGDNLAQ